MFKIDFLCILKAGKHITSCFAQIIFKKEAATIISIITLNFAGNLKK